MMASPPLLARRLAFVLGKGGVGKTTVTSALALGLADAGHRTLLIEVGSEQRSAALFTATPPLDGEPAEVQPGLFSISIDVEKSIEEYLTMQVRVKPLIELMVRSRVFHAVAQAAPGLAELVTLGKIWDLATLVRCDVPVWDRLVVDCPATGHGIALLDVAGRISELAGSGPIRDQAHKIEQVIHHPAATGIVVVAQPDELAVSEALEAVQTLRSRDLPVATAIMNAVAPSAFTEGDEPALTVVAADQSADDASRAAARAALASLRRSRHDARETAALAGGSGIPVATLPVVPDLSPGSGGLERLAAVLMADRAIRGPE